MELTDIHAAIEKIGCLTITTLDKDTPHSRIVSILPGDEDGVYFLTMNVKPFYRQLKANPHISLCGMYPTSRKEGKNKDGQPYFPPGFTFRLTGEAVEVADVEIEGKAKAGKEPFVYFLEDQERYPAMTLFRIHKGKGEIFDFDFEMEKRDHKLLRTRFAFGGEAFSEAGMRITDDCIACGLCLEECTFKAIEEGDPYRINGSRCDECGSCALVCPQEAIVLSETL